MNQNLKLPVEIYNDPGRKQLSILAINIYLGSHPRHPVKKRTVPFIGLSGT